jgi:Bacterial archaeo-eukaryotic release factor family 7
MDTLNRDQLKFLSLHRPQPCVSIFLPTHRGGPQTREDPIRLKNLIKDAESRLVALGQRPAAAREMLAPARQLASRTGFWRQQEDGLVLFVSNGLFQHFRLPLRFQEQVSVAERFEVSPVLPLFTAGGTFYLLALSRNHVRFFRGTPNALTQLEIGTIPQSVDEALKYDVRESQLQMHSGAGGSAAGKEGAVFTGQGIGVDDEEDRTREFLLQVERGVRGFLKDERAPLVLAGVEELVAVYRGINKYGTLLDGNVGGNPDLLKAHDLHAAALALIRPHVELNRKKALATYHDLSGSDRALGDLKRVLVSAEEGRVDTAFLPAGARQWGRFETARNAVEVHDEYQPGDEDLLNRIAAETVLHRGTVYLVAPDQMPNGSSVAAFLRY